MPARIMGAIISGELRGSGFGAGLRQRGGFVPSKIMCESGIKNGVFEAREGFWGGLMRGWWVRSARRVDSGGGAGMGESEGAGGALMELIERRVADESVRR